MAEQPLEINLLHERFASLEAENAQLQAEVQHLSAENAYLRAEMGRLQAENTRLQAENAELRRRLGLNSSNSHKLSSDGYRKKQTELFATVIPDFPVVPEAGLIGSLLWLIWMIVLGVFLIRSKISTAQ